LKADHQLLIKPHSLAHRITHQAFEPARNVLLTNFENLPDQTRPSRKSERDAGSGAQYEKGSPCNHITPD
jgi:hypothetical protein